MFAKYLILLGVVGFCKSADDGTALNETNRKAATAFFIKSGCKSGATDDQLAAAKKCFMAASTKSLYLEKALKAVGDNTCKANPKVTDTDVFAKFCHSIMSVDDPMTKTLIECIGKAEGRYPSRETIATTAECKAFL